MDQNPPTFFRIMVGLYALLTVFGAAVTLLVIIESKNINTAGGWGYLMAAFIFATAAFFVCLAGVVCTALSLWRGETHRRLSLGLLIVSSLVVWTLRRVPFGLVRLLLPHE
jgi:uncharacterized membrane protein